MATKGPKIGAKAPAAPTATPRAAKPKAATPVAAEAPKPKVVAPKPKAAAKPARPVAPEPIAAPVVEVAPVVAEPVVPAAEVVETVVEAAAVPVIETAETVTTAAVQAAQTAQKETTVMATQFEAPKVFADFNDRAKAAVEKGTKLVEEFNEFAKGNVEAVVESSRITAKGFETLGQEAAEYSRKSFEGFTATLKNLAAVKSPADFFKLQSDYVRSSFDSAVAEASKGTEAFIKLAGDAAQPISNRLAVAAEKVKTAA